MKNYKCPHCGHEMDADGQKYHWDGRYALADCFICVSVFVIFDDGEKIVSLKIERP